MMQVEPTVCCMPQSIHCPTGGWETGLHECSVQLLPRRPTAGQSAHTVSDTRSGAQAGGSSGHSKEGFAPAPGKVPKDDGLGGDFTKEVRVEAQHGTQSQSVAGVPLALVGP